MVLRYILTCILFLFPFGVLAATETKGFAEYVPQLDGKSSVFRCEEACFILVGSPVGDIFRFGGEFSGDGIIAYGFIVDGKIAPLWTERVGSQNEKKVGVFDIWAHPEKQIMMGLPLVVVVQGKISGKIEDMYFEKSTFFSRIQTRLFSYMRFDGFGPATINYIPGPRFGYESVNTTLYILFFLGGAIIIFAFRSKRRIAIFALGISFFVLYDLRMSAEFIRNYTYDLRNIYSQSSFRDRGDFYAFVDFSNQILEQSGKEKFSYVSFYTDNSWPFPGSMKYFLYPFRVLQNTPSDTIISYNSSRTALTASGLIVDGVLIGTGEIENFRPGAFIFFMEK